MRFVLPSIAMMLLTSVYSVVDGLFVSNLVGSKAFAAVNLIWPYLNIFCTAGFMFGTGGSALVSKLLGEGKKEKAKEVFSLIIYAEIILGIVLTIVAAFTIRPVSVLLGAEGELLENCVLYGRCLIFSLITMTLQISFQSFLVAAERPMLGLTITAASGISNIALDALFVAVFHWGLLGAGIATSISQAAGGLVGILFFIRNRKSPLHLGKTRFMKKELLKTCTNGISEFLTEICFSVVGIVYNYQLMQYIGEDGVTAYGIIMYASFIFAAIFYGYCLGSAPIISFHYGAGNHDELQNLFRKSLVIILISSALGVAAAELLAGAVASIFVSYDPELLEMTKAAFRIYSSSFLIGGINTFASSLFTSLNNGLVSGLMAFLRTFLFQVVAVLVLPVLFGIDGIWFAVIVAEVLALVVSLTCMVKYKGVYHYA